MPVSSSNPSKVRRRASAQGAWLALATVLIAIASAAALVAS